MKTFVAAATLQRAKDAAKELGLVDWMFIAPSHYLPLRGLRDFHLVLAGLDLNELPTLHHYVLVSRASGGRITTETV